jgi:DNA (cytosine-5)-methyltransferase 1
MAAEEGFLILDENRKPRWTMPIEAERLMGFPAGYTDIESATDTKRYWALGNSWCVPVARWVGKRIQMVEDLLSARSKGLQSAPNQA